MHCIQAYSNLCNNNTVRFGKLSIGHRFTVHTEIVHTVIL